MNANGSLALRLLKQANIADFVILLPFAVPVLAGIYLRIWSWLDRIIGGSGLPQFETDHLVFVNLAGAFAVVGVILRTRLITIATARAVGIFKLVVAAIFAAALIDGAARIFAVPLLADLVIGVSLLISARSAVKSEAIR